MKRVLLVLTVAAVVVATFAASGVAFATTLEFSPSQAAEFNQTVQSSVSYGWCWDPYYGWYYGWC